MLIKYFLELLGSYTLEKYYLTWSVSRFFNILGIVEILNFLLIITKQLLGIRKDFLENFSPK